MTELTNKLLPESFIDFIRPHLPSNQTLEAFVEYCHRPLRKSIRVNTLKITVPDFVSQVTEKGWQLQPIPWCDTGFWLTRPEQEEKSLALGNTFEHLSGLFYVQEASSMLPPVALLFNSQTPQLALDLAAAPGSKTTQLAALMANQGLLVANEFSSSRIKGLFSNIQRCGVANVALTHMDGRLLGHLEETFDSILLDAPCSGEGTVRKDPDAMKNWTEQSVHDIADTQFDLICAAFRALKIGGEMVYSTCTLNPFENQNICFKLQQEFGEAVTFLPLADLFPGAADCMTEDGFLHVWPQIYDSEGFFVAKIKKTASVNPNDQENPFKRLGKFPFSHTKQKQANEFQSFLTKQFNFSQLPLDNLYSRNNELWYFPTNIEKLAGKIKLDRIGVRLAEAHKSGFKLDHSLAITFGHLFSKQVIKLNTENAKSYLMGQDIRLTEQELPKELGKGEVIMMYKDQVIGLAKNLGNRIKNQLPRELVKDNLHNI
ncbi:16S rRNA (cytosine(1407)-C(5))-methyltransferase RsmF [Saccharobesus litoralis]|uniref:Ribosomal RNA small subunit methyltransferase F n=1 Tax=Saccharobesus litoralis TaxID=2172099 RepID=A0A2S0VUR1_9ALTE|nr:16S rRNA (cytosine(1407)-C(5))-methyltransferase RsmF [Saccharobesus litoralis]AWB67830.1 16S rRNA (cytosine(1407)-C(5))-methyltransferase RsmF [Saccharobesus litoralis]